ncbi:MAG: AAA family ATPase [Brumimicrobium sp.]|nr:AAA family ATPase [Brumimicrobium sp.]
MKIFDHFQHITLTNDQRNALKKLHAFLESNERVFILQGYAGSGKTTLLKGLIDYLKSISKQFDVMAPTGRAAKILRDKTGYGQTIHKTIYNFEELKTIQSKDNEDDHSFHYIFPIRNDDTDNKILIIDEASMVSSREAKNELFTFGTNVLLNDLLTYSGIPNSANKIIFVGDPAQLPPVGDNSSKALMTEYFEGLNITTNTSSLKEVVRQQDNTILENATKIRSLIGSEVRSELTLTYDETCFIKTLSEDIAHKYAKKFPLPEIGQGVIIAFSNAQCLQYNRSVRRKNFPECETVTQGDLLIINHNNYHTYDVELMNGEMAKVMDVAEDIIPRKNIPVYETINGKRIKKHITLNFRKVTIRVEHYSDEIECLIIDSLLNSPGRDLTIPEMKALYIDFVMRFQDEQKTKKEKGLPTFKVGSEEFKEQLKSDPYFNVLRVKYGYAITCHKSQGGEWQTTFVDYYGRTSLKDDPLRWSYTATTRAVKKCYAANAPNVSTFAQFNIGEVQPLTNVPVNALALENIPVSPFHVENQHRAKSLKYWEVREKLENSPFQLVSVQSLGGFQERYTISFEDENDHFDAHHNNAGIFNGFQAAHRDQYTWHQELLDLLNQPYQITYNIDYAPSIPVLEKLHGLMQSVCTETDVTITNIIEQTDNYHAIYFLKTDAKCALIQFYFNSNEQLTRAMPKSTDNGEDEKLNKLISKLRAHVI